MIDLASTMRAADRRGESLGLSVEELAFYDALCANDSAVEVLGDAVLRSIALELVETVRRNTAIDWTLRDSRARQAPHAHQARAASAGVSARQAR